VSDLVTVPKLSKAEQQALALYEKERQVPLSPSLQAQFFNLYLNGKSCFQIQQLNPGFHLGAIVKARLDGEWDRRLNEYRDELLNTATERAKTVSHEAIGFVGDMLSATHKFHGRRLAKYLQTGDEGELGDLDIKSIKNYKAVLELMMSLTGQGGKGTTINLNASPAPPPEPNKAPIQLTPEVAAAILLSVNAKEDANASK